MFIIQGMCDRLKTKEIGEVSTMPHIAVKLYAGRTQEQKEALTKELIKTVKNTLGAGEDYISVTIEDFDPAEWTEKVFKPDIEGKKDVLFKAPKY